MVLLSEIVNLKWNRMNRKYYIKQGYQFTNYTDEFKVNIHDVKPTSTVKVNVRCDYCGSEMTKEIRAYYEQRKIIKKDCCANRKCMVEKTKEVNLITIGVESVNQLPEKREKSRKLFQTPIEEVFKIAENKGLEIVDYSGYENSKSKIKVTCNFHPELGIHDTNVSNMKSQTHCCKIGGQIATANARRVNGEKVVEDFIKSGLILLFKAEDYKTNTQPLPYECPSHPNLIQYRQYSNLPYTNGCLQCAKERSGDSLKLNQEDVFSYFESKNLLIEKGEIYKDKDTHLACRCVFHPEEIQYKTYGSLKKTDEPCIYCRHEKSINELNRMLRSSIGKWRKDSEKACDFKCVLTESIKYEIHHLYSFNQIIKDVISEININLENYSSEDIIKIKNKVITEHEKLLGVCLHPSLHILFHQLYGKDFNTPEQFEEFKTRYRLGEFNEILNIT